MTTQPLTVCITAYNEADNLDKLALLVAFLRDRHGERIRFSIVDNGSNDQTWHLLTNEFAENNDVHISQIKANCGYGGGMISAALAASTRWVALVPADGQYAPSDVSKVVEVWDALSSYGDHVVKGARQQRLDPARIRALSVLYSSLCRVLFQLKVDDVNGLPKILPREIFSAHAGLLPTDAVLDAALMQICQSQRLPVVEVGVSYEARERGPSSWSGRIVQVSLAMAISAIRSRARLARRRELRASADRLDRL